MQVSKTGPNTFTGSKLTQTAGTLTYAGTLTNVLSSGTLASGDSIPLFNAPAYGGGFSSVTAPTQAGLTANASQLTGGTGGNISYACDGSFAITTTSLPDGTYGSAYNQTVTASGAVSFGATGLPAGLSINNSGVISGTPTAVGPSSVSIDATNDVGCTASATVSLKVSKAPLSITASNASKSYGQTVTFAGTEFSTSGLVGGDTVSSVTLTSAGAVSTATPGSYDIVPSAAVGSGLGNYTITYNNGTLAVSAATRPVAQSIEVANGSAIVTFSGTPNTIYVTQSAADLNGSWTNISTNTPPTSTWSVTNSVAGDDIRFYRALIP